MKKIFGKNPRTLGKFKFDRHTLLLLIIFVVVMAFFSIVNADKGFISGRSLTSMGLQLSEIGILAIAMMVTSLVGGINLSIVAVANLGSVLSGYFLFLNYPPEVAAGTTATFTNIKMPDDPSMWVLIIAILIPIVVGVLSGILNGYIVGYIGVPPILATLATMSVFTGMSAGLTGGRTITGFPAQFSVVANETVWGIPIPFILFIFLTAITYVILNHTTLGFKMRMVGTNDTASEFSGINNKAVIMKTYILSGALASIAGLIIMSRTMSAAYEYGSTTYVLLTILIAVLAGIQSGFGNVLNIFVSMLILQALSTGFQMLLQTVRGSTFFKDFAWGVLLIIIFAINYLVRQKKTGNKKRPAQQ
ncbi:MAG: ABC transporter permease [Anaerolineaceae bacterium]|nr:ABC transporter permease [Anaerolineaceae bacterium]